MVATINQVRKTLDSAILLVEALEEEVQMVSKIGKKQQKE